MRAKYSGNRRAYTTISRLNSLLSDSHYQGTQINEHVSKKLQIVQKQQVSPPAASRAVVNERGKASHYDRRGSNRDIKLVLEVATIIEENLENTKFRLKDLSNFFPFEERQLRNKIKSVTGLCPKKFQQEIALQRARLLLEKKVYVSLKAVAYSVGIFHVTRFSKLFKTRFGVHPGIYCR